MKQLINNIGLFLVLLLLSGYALAAEDDGTYVEGRFFGVTYNGSFLKFATLGEAVSYASSNNLEPASLPSGYTKTSEYGHDPYAYTTSIYNVIEHTSGYQTHSSIFSVTHYYCSQLSDPGSCPTVGPAAPECPDAGAQKRLGYTKTETPGNYDGGLVLNITNGASQGASIVRDGCGYERLPSAKPDDCYLYAYDSEGRQKWNCYANYQATGEAADTDPNSGVEYFDESEDDAPKEADGVKDTRQSSVTKTSTDPVTEMVGDKKVTRKTEITTDNRGDGAVIEKQDDITVITESDGITKTETKTTTTTTNPDGSQTIETTNNISYTQHPQVIYNIDNSENKITVSEAPGGTTSQTVTTKDTYDAEGNQTGSEQSTGPVQGDDVAKESEEKQTCENNPFMDKCLDDFKKTAKGEFGDISAKITEAKSDFESKWAQIKTEASSKLGFTLNGGGALEQHIVVIRGVEADIGITRWVPYFDEFGLAALIMAGAALYAAIIMFRG